MTAPGQQNTMGKGAVTGIILAGTFFQAVSMLGTFATPRDANGRYAYSILVMNFLMELSKFIVSIILFFTTQTAADRKRNLAQLNKRLLLLFGVPALLYVGVNYLYVLIMEFVDPSIAVLLLNLKIVTTTVFARTILKQNISRIQFFSIYFLLVGVSISSFPFCRGTLSGNYIAAIFIAVIFSLMSGGAGIYTEFVLKKYKDQSLHMQNACLYLWGILSSLVTAVFLEKEKLQEGIFSGFNGLVWVIVFVRACGGLSISGIMKYASNVVKVFTACVAMACTTLLEWPLFGLPISGSKFFGVMLVGGATLLYSLPESKPEKAFATQPTRKFADEADKRSRSALLDGLPEDSEEGDSMELVTPDICATLSRERSMSDEMPPFAKKDEALRV